MNYKITVNGQTYEVKIEDLNARPVIAWVNGQRYEVLPEDSHGGEQMPAPLENLRPMAVSAAPQTIGADSVIAPLPGVVTEVFVKAGEVIESGQVILVIEAMKMKNSIRAPRAGKVSEVLASAGQSVTHKQALIKFES